MKKQFYVGVVLITFIASVYACHKQSANFERQDTEDRIVLDDSVSTSNDSNRLKAFVQIGLDSFHHGEILQTIDSIVTHQTATNQYILIYYHSNLGISNILFKGDYQGGQLFATTTTKCEGSCDCKVQVVYDKDVTISCTCNTCTMLITHTAFADFQGLVSALP